MYHTHDFFEGIILHFKEQRQKMEPLIQNSLQKIVTEIIHFWTTNKLFLHFTSMGESHRMCHQSDTLHKYRTFVFIGNSYNESNLSLRMMATHTAKEG